MILPGHWAAGRGRRAPHATTPLHVAADHERDARARIAKQALARAGRVVTDAPVRYYHLGGDRWAVTQNPESAKPVGAGDPHWPVSVSFADRQTIPPRAGAWLRDQAAAGHSEAIALLERWPVAKAGVPDVQELLAEILHPIQVNESFARTVAGLPSLLAGLGPDAAFGWLWRVRQIHVRADVALARALPRVARHLTHVHGGA